MLAEQILEAAESSEFQSDSPLPVNPFPGLPPFDVKDSAVFFGRDEEILELLSRLRRSRFLAVVGSSGCGKSSLIRAGLIASLRAGAMVDSDARWRTALLRPGSAPISQLAKALNHPKALGKEERQSSQDVVALEATLRRGALGVIEAVREANLPRNDRILILVDQFEELFRFVQNTPGHRTTDEGRAFVKLLLEAIAQNELPIYIVLTMRSDFLGECAQFPGLPDAINRGLFLVPQMQREQLRQTITEPLKLYAGGPNITGRLINRLLNESESGADQLPVLQHLLMRLWVKREAGTQESLDFPQYEALGGIKGALEQHASEILESLSPDGQVTTEKLFRAITDTTAENQTVRSPATLSQITEDSDVSEPSLREVIDAFRAPGCSFLMPPLGVPLKEDTAIDISHEAIIRQWPLLREWASTEAREREIGKRISAAALTWERKNRDKSYLFDGAQLREVEEWWKERSRKLSVLEYSFLESGIAAREDDLAKHLVAEADLKTKTLREGKSLIFIAYATADAEFAQRLSDHLKLRDREVSLASTELLAGKDWANEIKATLESSDVILAVLSPKAVLSESWKFEMGEAVRLGKRIVPVLHQTVSRGALDPILSRLNAVDFRKNSDFELNFSILETAIDSDSSWVREHTRLLVRATEWDTRKRESSLLLRGRELEKAARWLEQDDEQTEPRPTNLQRKYIELSLEAQKEEERQARAARNRIRIVTLFSVVVLVLGALAFGLGIKANQNAQEARTSEQRALKSEQRALKSEQEAKNNAQQAEANKKEAQANARRAKKNEESAKKSEKRAKDNAAKARENEQKARRSAQQAQKERSRAEGQTKIAAEQRDEARKQRERATVQAALALRERNEALLQRKRAQEQAVLALNEKNRADKQARIAAQERDEAVKQKRIAEELRRLSNQQKIIAEQEAERATKAADRATKAEALATKAKKQADKAAEDFKRASLVAQNLLKAQRKAGAYAESADGKYFVTASSAGKILMGEKAAPGSVKEVDVSKNEVTYLTFGPDALQLELIIGDDEGNFSLKEFPALLPASDFQGHRKSLRKAVFSPSGKLVATISDDGTARVWDIETGKEKFHKSSFDSKKQPIELLNVEFIEGGEIVKVYWANGMTGSYDSETGAGAGRFPAPSPETNPSAGSTTTTNPNTSMERGTTSPLTRPNELR